MPFTLSSATAVLYSVGVNVMRISTLPFAGTAPTSTSCSTVEVVCKQTTNKIPYSYTHNPARAVNLAIVLYCTYMYTLVKLETEMKRTIHRLHRKSRMVLEEGELIFKVNWDTTL